MEFFVECIVEIFLEGILGIIHNKKLERFLIWKTI